MRRYLVPAAPPGLEPGELPRFSVVIPAYQAAGTIRSAIESVLAQTAPAHEVIVCDDGSTDDLETVLGPYRSTIVLLRQDNHGVASARNAAIAAATGDFIALLDADDIYEPQRLQAMQGLASARPDLDIVMTDLRFERNDGTGGRWTSANPFPTGDQLGAILERCFIAVPAVRATALLELGGFDESLRTGEDWDCWIRLMLSGSRAGLVDEALYRYRINPASLTTADRAAALRDRVTVLERIRARPDLDADRRVAIDHSFRRITRRAVLAEAEDALIKGAPDARRKALRVATLAGVPAFTRARAAIAALAPELAGTRLRARRAAGTSRLDRSVPP
jgi:glycosyltransferase involved in cell wall biosynthesis